MRFTSGSDSIKNNLEKLLNIKVVGSKEGIINYRPVAKWSIMTNIFGAIVINQLAQLNLLLSPINMALSRMDQQQQL